MTTHAAQNTPAQASPVPVSPHSAKSQRGPRDSAPPFPVRRADRLAAVPPFLFNQIDDRKRAAIAAGMDVINLGTGDPDRPTPPFIVERMAHAIANPANHTYPDGYGTRTFLAAAAGFMQARFGVRCDPARHIVALIGGKDGISHLPLGLVNPGDSVITFPPAYPVYASGTVLAGGIVHAVETDAAHAWLPDLGAIPSAAHSSRLMWINFPNNPTGAVAPLDLLDDALRWCVSRSVICASDLAYSEVYFDKPVHSLWQAPSADIERTPAIEFHSLSKTFNMTGWRIGFAVGHEDVVRSLKQVKDNYDSGPFNAVQEAAALALDRFDDPAITLMRDEYRTRRDIVVAAMRRLGCDVTPPDAGIFVWSACPPARSAPGPAGSAPGPARAAPLDSWDFVTRAIDAAGVVMVPGAGFAQTATGFVRISLTRETARIAQAMERLAKVAW